MTESHHSTSVMVSVNYVFYMGETFTESLMYTIKGM
jgi:hypothetical protein